MLMLLGKRISFVPPFINVRLHAFFSATTPLLSSLQYDAGRVRAHLSANSQKHYVEVTLLHDVCYLRLSGKG